MQTSNLAPNRLFVRTPGFGGIFGVTCFLGIQGHMGLFEGLLWRRPEAQRGMAGAVRHRWVSCLDGVQVVFSFGKPVRARSRSGADASSALVTSDSRPATRGFVSSLKPGLSAAALYPHNITLGKGHFRECSVKLLILRALFFLKIRYRNGGFWGFAVFPAASPSALEARRGAARRGPMS